MSIKREEIKAIFPDATDEQLKSAMDLNWNDVEKLKSKVEELNSKLKAKQEDFDNLNAEFDKLKADGASGEEWKTKYEALQADITAKEKQAEADRILAEKTADIEKRFNECVGDKKFSHDAVRKSYLEQFGKAIESEEYKGKGDTDILHALTKDDAGAFAGVQVVKLAGGNPNNVGKKYTSKDEIMKIKNDTERQQAILENGSLFGI